MGIEITMRASKKRSRRREFGCLRIRSVMISDAAAKYTKMCSLCKKLGALEQFPSLVSINDFCRYRGKPTEYGRACCVWANDERSRYHSGRYWYKYDQSKPPPDFHFVQPVDKSPEVEQKTKFDGK